MGLVPLALLLAVVVTVAIGTAVVRRSPPSRETAVAAGRTHAVHSAGAALLLGSLAAGYVGATQLGNGSPGGLGVTALLVPITFGIVHTLVLAAGELTWPRPQGEVRRARLVHRGLLDAAPRWLVRHGGRGRRAGRHHARRRRPPGRRRRPQLQPTGTTWRGRAACHRQPLPRPLLRRPGRRRPARPRPRHGGHAPDRRQPAGRGHRGRGHRVRAAPGLGPPGAPGGGRRSAVRHRRAALRRRLVHCTRSRPASSRPGCWTSPEGRRP